MVTFYIMLARPVGRFFTFLRMNFPVMLIADDICGLRLGLCRYVDVGIGVAPLVCPYLQHLGYRYGQAYLTGIFSPCATNTGKRIVSTSTRIRSDFPHGMLQIQVDILQDLWWQTEVLTIRADKSSNK